MYNKSEVDRFLEEVANRLKYDGLLWVAYPKGTSKIKTDVNRDKGWDLARKLNLITIAIVSLDETWSAVRLRPMDKVKNTRS